MVRTLVAVLILPLAVLLGGSTFPATIPLPDDFQPEGLAHHGATFYTGSMVDGDIYRGNLRTGHGAVWVDTSGRQATGMKVDARHGLLLVAGGFTGHAYAYDLATGTTVADLTLAPAGQLINDVVLTGDAAYFTNSIVSEIYRVPLAADGSIGTPVTVPVTGPASGPTTSFGLNGIAVTPIGATLIVDRTDTGGLYTVDAATGASRQIVVDGTLVPGTLDGILRVRHRLFVVENFADTVVRLTLSPRWRTARVTDSVTDPDFEVPTAVVRHRSHRYVVNAKFDLGFPPPVGPGAPPGTSFELVRFAQR